MKDGVDIPAKDPNSQQFHMRIRRDVWEWLELEARKQRRQINSQINYMLEMAMEAIKDIKRGDT